MYQLRLSFQFCRQFAGRSTNSSSRLGRAEMTFKDSSELASPYDVLDRNIHGIQKRSILNEIRKLNEQVELDLPELKKLQSLNIPQENSEKDIIYNTEISYKAFTHFPGLLVPSEEACDPSVHVKVAIDSLGLSSLAVGKLKTFFNLPQDAETFEFSVSDFPFISQNKKRAMAVLEQLIQFSQNDSVSIADILGSDYVTQDSFNVENSRKKLSNLKFPQEWLDEAEAAKRNKQA
jgi:hypothetical protein